jgi:hypothetical protein
VFEQNLYEGTGKQLLGSQKVNIIAKISSKDLNYNHLVDTEFIFRFNGFIV